LVSGVGDYIEVRILDNNRQTYAGKTGEVIDIVTHEGNLSPGKAHFLPESFQRRPLIPARLHTTDPELAATG
jgi:hypothetical protein